VFSIFQNSNPQSPNIKVAPKYPRNTLTKFEINPKSFDTIWHEFCLGLNSADRAGFTPQYLLTQAISSLGTHTRQRALGTVKRRYTRSLARYACLGRPTGIWTRAETHIHVFDRVLKRSASHWLPSARAPRMVGSCPPHLHPAMPEGAYKCPWCAAVHSSLRLTPRAETPTPASSPPPAITARARPPWPTLPVDPQPRPNPWTASPRGGEAFPSLSRGIASPEKRARHRRTSADRHRAWTGSHSEPFSNSLHPHQHWPPMKLPEHLDLTLPPWAGRSTHRRRARPPAHAASPPLVTTTDDPHLDVIATDPRTSLDPSPDLYHHQ
jgi:hypothetical protein